MTDEKNIKGELFDEWPEKYDRWFETPIGALVKKYESELLLDLLQPQPAEMILDAGCGTGVFTFDILHLGPRITGLDISYPMLKRAELKAKGYPFRAVAGDMKYLPFADECFDRVVSMTALEFIEDGQGAVKDLLRVTKKGGVVVATTLNSLSPWADRRKIAADKGHSLFKQMIFRSPDDMRALVPIEATVKTAIHFLKEDDPQKAPEIERDGKKRGLDTGAFVAARWVNG
ncbi:MAG: class I SAM-dependent methyltransferase [Desulfobacteraceae bacterium]|jgi:ubiquinone/menaquinone biosynthesis C-methylase UbiE|nr:class I SAM-dependent methyltransferase [Desulfobacteraceae bacterium]